MGNTNHVASYFHRIINMDIDLAINNCVTMLSNLVVGKQHKKINAVCPILTNQDIEYSFLKCGMLVKL